MLPKNIAEFPENVMFSSHGSLYGYSIRWRTGDTLWSATLVERGLIVTAKDGARKGETLQLTLEELVALLPVAEKKA